MLSIDRLIEVYGDQGEEPFYGPCNYEKIIDAWGYKELVNVSSEDYQGDTHVILHDTDTDKYGYLTFGWGSCSGCDALQACETWKEIKDLADGLHDAIMWKDSARELLDYFENKDWETEYMWHEEEFKSFLDQSKASLNELL